MGCELPTAGYHATNCKAQIGPPVFNHLPVPGTKFTWAGEVYILEAR